MGEWTKGPWLSRGSATYAGEVVAPSARGGAVVARVTTPQTGGTTDERQAAARANARLIAAAPELAEALRDLREACEQVYATGRISAEPFVRAGNVLAKAEGR